MSERMSFRFLGNRYVRAEFVAKFPAYASYWHLVVGGCTSPHEIEMTLFKRSSGRRGKRNVQLADGGAVVRRARK